MCDGVYWALFLLFDARFTLYYYQSIDVGAGAQDLAAAVQKASQITPHFKFLYDLNLTIEEKIETICKEIYRADGIELSGLYIKWDCFSRCYRKI